MSKTLKNSTASGARVNVPDLVIVGEPDPWKLLSKAYSESEGWMKSTKAMKVGGGVVIQVTTQQLNEGGTYSLAEAITFVPDNGIEKDSSGNYHLFYSKTEARKC